MVQFQHESEGLRTKKGDATISSPKAISSRSKKSHISVKSRDWKRPVSNPALQSGSRRLL